MTNDNPKSKILLADDHRVVIEGIRSALADEPEFEVVGEAANGAEAVNQVKALRPDIVVMDISMPGVDGIQATRDIISAAPDIRIVIFTMHGEKEFVVRLFELGIAAYVLKEDPMSDLILALKAVRNGSTYFSARAPSILVRHMKEMQQGEQEKEPYASLSQREREVFLLLARGKRMKDIAEELCRSPKTVETHKYRIMDKLGVESVTELTRLAIRKNLMEP